VNRAGSAADAGLIETLWSEKAIGLSCGDPGHAHLGESSSVVRPASFLPPTLGCGGVRWLSGQSLPVCESRSAICPQTMRVVQP